MNTQVAPAVRPMLGIAGGHSKNQAEVGADGSVSQASANAHGASAFRPDRRLAAAGVETAVDFSDHLDPLFHRPSDREPIGEDIVLPIALDRIGENAETRVSNHSNRLHGLPQQRGERKISRIEAEAALVARVWQLGRKAQSDGRMRWRLGHDSNLRDR